MNTITDQDKREHIISEALENCLRFMHIEMGWEYFREEMLYSNDKEAKVLSLKNAETLRRYLRDTAAKYPELAEIFKRASN